MATWPLGSKNDDDEAVRRSENEGFGQEAELEHAEDKRTDEDLRDEDLKDDGFKSDDLRHDELKDDDLRDDDLRNDDLRHTEVVDGEVVEADNIYTKDDDLRDVDAQDRHVANEDVPVASAPVVETDAGVPLQDSPAVVDDTTPPQDTPVQDVPVTHQPSTEGQSLFESGYSGTFQERWREIQAGFVDDPHETVRKADELADEVVNTLTTTLADRKRGLDERWQAEKENTEELRLALRGYRDLLDRLVQL